MPSNSIVSHRPLVSIGIPTYNRPDGLRKALESAVGQTYDNIEIIVSDNCSPGEETEAVIKEFMARDARISYHRQQCNQGLYFNFFYVLEQAVGAYFMWLADDDWIDSNYVQKCMDVL